MKSVNLVKEKNFFWSSKIVVVPWDESWWLPNRACWRVSKVFLIVRPVRRTLKPRWWPDINHTGGYVASVFLEKGVWKCNRFCGVRPKVFDWVCPGSGLLILCRGSNYSAVRSSRSVEMMLCQSSVLVCLNWSYKFMSSRFVVRIFLGMQGCGKLILFFLRYFTF